MTHESCQQGPVRRETKRSIVGMSTNQGVASLSGASCVSFLEEDASLSSRVPSASQATYIRQPALREEQATAADVCRQTSPEELPMPSEDDYHALRLHSAAGPCKPDTCPQVSTTAKLHTPERDNGAQRRYHCNSCSRTYAHIQNLKVHKRAHTSETPYVCRLCPAAFAGRFALLTHALSTHEAVGLHACCHCEKKFALKSNLERHLMVHSGETPHSCHLCPKRFSRRDSLLVHLRIHAGQRPHGCVHCDRRFSTASNLGTHVRGVHSSDPTYKCKHCPRKFRWRYSLKTHLKTHHTQAKKQ